MTETVKIWEENVSIPTYEAGEADRNPMFLEKRVYQGSSGKVYPYPTTEKISHEKKDKTYRAVYLENRYLKIMVLPELGGRIQRAYDKTIGYDFVYYNHVIKPALVGLVGPWISGGIEFNWPQHHRPTTFMPVDYYMQENQDGSKTLFVNDVDQMYGTKGIAGFTLYPDKAYLEIRGQLYNRTALPQTFLWWANPAVAVNDNTQSIFPPDVHSVYDHGKRDVSRFPIASGIYYKHDYSEGVDISRYKNIPVPTSYMAEKSSYDFVGGYDYGKEAGVLHIADHHVSPGKKQWTWGCGEFGKAWDRILTDEDGPYIELMTGMFTDNQPDFTWLKPFEEKSFTQYFMPYKKVGQVKNATIEAVLGTKFQEGKLSFCVYGTDVYEHAKIQVFEKGTKIYEKTATLSPEQIFEDEIKITAEKESDLKVQVSYGKEILVSYQAEDTGIPQLAEPAKAVKEPEEIQTCEELFLAGQHIEQYRHATFLPDPYYLEGLKRDSEDIRINNAYGKLLLRRGDFAKAEEYFRKALKRLTRLNPNPYDSEPYYNLGVVLFYQEQWEEAYDSFFKAAWSNEQQEMSFYYMAAIQNRKQNYKLALEHIEKALIKNSHNIKARGLKVAILAAMGESEKALFLCRENLAIDHFDYCSLYLQSILDKEKQKEILQKLQTRMRNFHENYLQAARDFGEWGAYQEAIDLLKLCTADKPMLFYYTGFYYGKVSSEQEEKSWYERANAANPYCCFPNKLEDIAVLTRGKEVLPKGAKASYYLGNLYYDKLQFEKAIENWELSEQIDDSFPTVLRNLAIAYYNKEQKPKLAGEKLEKAYGLDTKDARVFLELDQLRKKQGVPFMTRLSEYEKHKELIVTRDDLYIEYVTLLNLTGQHREAYEAIMKFEFRPWEGAEGKITTQYKISLLEQAKEALKNKDCSGAKELVEKALKYPENLGEGRLEGTKDNHLYYTMGLAMEGLGENEEAQRCFERSAIGNEEPAGMMYYYDQPADMILYQGLAHEKLGRTLQAKARFHKLIDYGERHLRDEMKTDYFAVSLPDFLIFEEDLNQKNKAHCYYLMGLGNLGLGNKKAAEEFFDRALEADSNHQNAIIYKKMLQ